MATHLVWNLVRRPARGDRLALSCFRFEVQLKVEGEGGQIEHSELVFGGGLIKVGGERHEKMPFSKPPSKAAGGSAQSMMVFVDDVETHCARGRAAGAVITREPETHDYGDDYWVDRTYECRDIGGHHWWFTQWIRAGGKNA